MKRGGVGEGEGMQARGPVGEAKFFNCGNKEAGEEEEKEVEEEEVEYKERRRRG